ncbi:MAG TPA: prepilin-type N-terminal cleavage/methylation domain-containing protein, partial [Bacillota bacterium]|nr:prepilin-type N-terminal cleavage/methylation domain-containing protein [Bacillota bacterium]
MPILETGSRSGGFTLLEMLAVIVLMGMVMMIVYPRFELNEEKTEVLFIGRLVTGDVELLQGEALANREILTLHFSKDGYDFKIGESTVSRSFHRFEFKFAIPEEEPKEDTGSEAPEGTPAATEGQEPTGEEPTGQDL